MPPRRFFWIGNVVLLACCLLPLQAEILLEKGLVLHLPLLADLQDHSPARQRIEVVGAVRIESEGAYFGGRKDWLEAPHIALHERPFAIALWLKSTAPDRQVGFLEQFDLNQPGHHLCLMLRENRQPYFGFYVRDSISPLSAGWAPEWMHLVFEYTGEFQQIWINGRLIARTRSAPFEGTTGVTAIGKSARWSNVNARDFVGYMRDFRIYQRVLTTDEIGFLAGRGKVAGKIGALTTTAATTSAPSMSRTFAAFEAILPGNPAVPFLEIDQNRVTINGRAGGVYLLERSAGLADWIPLGRLTNTTGQVTYDGEQTGSMQFYRVQIE